MQSANSMISMEYGSAPDLEPHFIPSKTVGSDKAGAGTEVFIRFYAPPITGTVLYVPTLPTYTLPGLGIIG